MGNLIINRHPVFLMADDMKRRYFKNFTNNSKAKSINKYKFIASLFVDYGGQNGRAKRY